MKMSSIVTSICIFFSTLFSCQQKKEFKSVSVEEFSTLIADPNVQLLDVRTATEYAEGHISGSINIDVNGKDFPVIAGATLKKDNPVAVYCRSGKRSRHAASILSQKGYTVYNLDAGILSWENAGKEIEK